MVEWRKRVEEHLKDCNQPARIGAEAITEIAGHVEDVYEELVASGMPFADAEKAALDEIGEPLVLCRRISEARERRTMSSKTKNLFLPTMATLVLTLVGLMAVPNGMFPHGFALTSEETLFLYFPWIFGSFAAGVLGGFWARKTAGKARPKITALYFCPACALVILILARPPISWNVVRLHPAALTLYFVECLTLWAILPACAIFVGGLTGRRLPQVAR
jgi:hypothetical protein